MKGDASEASGYQTQDIKQMFNFTQTRFHDYAFPSISFLFTFPCIFLALFYIGRETERHKERRTDGEQADDRQRNGETETKRHRNRETYMQTDTQIEQMEKKKLKRFFFFQRNTHTHTQTEKHTQRSTKNRIERLSKIFP